MGTIVVKNFGLECADFLLNDFNGIASTPKNIEVLNEKIYDAFAGMPDIHFTTKGDVSWSIWDN